MGRYPTSIRRSGEFLGVLDPVFCLMAANFYCGPIVKTSCSVRWEVFTSIFFTVSQASMLPSHMSPLLPCSFLLLLVLSSLSHLPFSILCSSSRWTCLCCSSTPLLHRQLFPCWWFIESNAGGVSFHHFCAIFPFRFPPLQDVGAVRGPRCTSNGAAANFIGDGHFRYLQLARLPLPLVPSSLGGPLYGGR